MNSSFNEGGMKKGKNEKSCCIGTMISSDKKWRKKKKEKILL